MPATSIMFVDDERHILDGIRRTVSRRKWRDKIVPSFYEDGASALLAIAQNPPDILVTDMEMPGMRGEELLQRTREQCPSVQTFVLSGKGIDNEVIRLVRSEGRFLSKPFNASQLMKFLNIANDYQVETIIREERSEVETKGAADKKFEVDPILPSTPGHQGLDRREPPTIGAYQFAIEVDARQVKNKALGQGDCTGAVFPVSNSENVAHFQSRRPASFSYVGHSRLPEEIESGDALAAAKGFLLALPLSILIWSVLVLIVL